jgi:PAS domain S-box-containing protein
MFCLGENAGPAVLHLFPGRKRSETDSGKMFSRKPSSTKRPAWARYGVAVGGVVLGWLAREALTPGVGPTALPFIFFFPAAALAAWYGGFGPGALATVLGVATASWFFIEPVHTWSIAKFGDVVALGAFLVSCLFIVGAIEAMHRARARLSRAEREAASARDLLATTVVSIGDAVIVTDETGKVTFLNPEAERLTGWRNTEANGQPLPEVFRIINEQTRQPSENPVEKVFRTGKVAGLANHTLLIAKDGTETPIDDSAAPIREPGSPLFGVVLVFRDVTEQRRAQQASARLAAIVEHSGDAIFTKDLNGMIQAWNPASERLFGYRPEEVVGKPVTVLFPPDRLTEEDHILVRLREGRPVERMETIRVAKNGRHIPVAISVSPLKNGDGKVIGASKIIHDITDLVAAREALLREKELLATTLASIGDGVIVTDEQGRITFLNPEAEKLTGWKTGEAAGRPLPEIFRIINEQTRQPVENPVEKVLRFGSVVGLANHTILIAKDNREIPIDDSAAPIRQPDGPLFGVVLVFRDFTEHNRTEAKLQELALFPAQNPAPILRIARDGTLLHANPAALTLRPEWNLAVGQAAPAPLFSLAADALNAKQASERELAIGERTYLMAVVPIADFGYANLYGLDVTERQRAEHALREAQERLTGLINSAMDAVIAVDAQQRIILFNPAAEQMFGSPASQAVGSSLDRFIPARFREAHGRHIEKFGQTGVTTRRMGALGALSGLRSNGEEFPIEAAISQMEVRGQKLFTVILRDITERKKSEEQQSRLAAIVESSRDAIMSKSLEGIVTSWNAGAEASFGYSASEMIGQPIQRIIPEELRPEEETKLSRLRAGLNVEHYESVRVTKEGKRLPVSVTISPIKDSKGMVISASVVMHDISEQKRINDALREAQRKLLLHAVDLEATVAERTAKLRESVNELQTLSYSIAHDMRAPLRAMGTFAQLLLEESSDRSAVAQDYSRRIVIAAKRLDSLIQDALNYTKALLQEFPLQPVQLSGLVRGIIDTYPNLQPDKADIQIEGDLPAVLGNEALLTQCFSNLLGNAVKFVAPGIRPQVRVWSEVNDGVCRIWIRDNGIGIPEQAQPRLFGMFQKLDSQYEGTGIGLAIVRKVVERMGGKVGVESEPRNGSRFWVELRPSSANPRA